MCVIAAKKAGVPMIEDKLLENMWSRNPDGAGFMYAKDGKVYIEKGFMTIDALKDRLSELGKTYSLRKHSLVLHFRITTSGGTRPENCHPFPVSDSLGMLKKRKTSAKIGVAHNGMIDITPRSKDISDTMEYIASQLAPLSRFCPRFFTNKDAMTMIQNAIASKMCFMDGNGNLYTTGEFHEKDGVLYSNKSYENGYGLYRWNSFGKYYGDSGWSDEDDAAFWAAYYGTKKSTQNAYGIYVESKYLMPVDDTGGYLVDEKGERFPLEELDGTYIDGLERVWCYDLECDTCWLWDGAYVVSAENIPIRYDYKKAERMYCSEED